MAYFVVQDFRGGLNVTRPPYASDTGTLQTGINCHLTRGGDVEKRKAFVSKYTLPAGTFGLAATLAGLYTFGSGADPGVPAGVTYVRLQNGAKTMAAVLMAEAFLGKLYVIVQWSDGTVDHFYDGAIVSTWSDGHARCSLALNVLESPASITAITISGANILAATFNRSGTELPIDFLARLATTINGGTSGFTATSDSTKLYLASSTVGAGLNGVSVAYTATGVGFSLTNATFQGGNATAVTPGKSIRTFKNKLYSTSDARIHACGIDAPMEWSDVNQGAWYADVSGFAAGAQALITTGKYYSNLVIFARDTTMVWHVESDPENNAELQEISDIGAIGRRAVATARDGGVAFLSAQGVKSLIARDSSNVAVVVDMSLPIDPLLIPRISAASTTTTEASIMTYEPEEGRLWVILGTSIYVLSNFAGARVHAWTEYQPGFAISDVATFNHRIYVRSGNTVYLYGGDSNATYDTSMVDVILPYATMRVPATFKTLLGLDAGLEGTWDLYVRPEPGDATQEEQVAAAYTGVSYDSPAIPLAGHTTHLSIRLKHSTAEYARLTGVALHYESNEAD